MIYTIERVISDNKNFLVLEVADEYGHTDVAYINSELDMNKKYYTKEELKIIVW